MDKEILYNYISDVFGYMDFTIKYHHVYKDTHGTNIYFVFDMDNEIGHKSIKKDDIDKWIMDQRDKKINSITDDN